MDSLWIVDGRSVDDVMMIYTGYPQESCWQVVGIVGRCGCRTADTDNGTETCDRMRDECSGNLDN